MFSTDARLLIDLGDLVATFLDESDIFAGSNANAPVAEMERKRPTMVDLRRMMVWS